MIQLSMIVLAGYGIIMLLVGLCSWRIFAWLSYTALFGLLAAIFWQFHHMSQLSHKAHETPGDVFVPLVALVAFVAVCAVNLVAGSCAHWLRLAATPEAKDQDTGSEA